MARGKTNSSAEQRDSFWDVATRLSEIGREFCGRGWALGTSGNFSAVISKTPLRMAITATGIDKSHLNPNEILEVNAGGRARNGSDESSNASAARASASAETLLHVTIARTRGAGAVLHTHSIWGTILSAEFAAQGGIAIEGYEMLKGLAGVRTHEHREWLPILPNRQDMAGLAKAIGHSLRQHPAAHGFLLEGHGLYSWGRDLEEARRHVEILEFLLEVVGRRLSADSVPSVLSVGDSGRQKTLRRGRKSG
jgi:methylthioribulose-1-phosphate dehydratase